MLHWPSTPTSGEANTERLASFAKDDHIAHILSIWSKSIRLIVCLHNDISYFILTCYSWESFDVSNHPSFPIWCYNASPHTMKPSPVPLTESLFSVSRAWPERKDTVTGIGNHEKVTSHLQTGSVRSQGETSLTLFLLAVYHFVWKIALAGHWLQSHPNRFNLTSTKLLTWRVVPL